MNGHKVSAVDEVAAGLGPSASLLSRPSALISGGIRPSSARLATDADSWPHVTDALRRNHAVSAEYTAPRRYSSP